MRYVKTNQCRLSYRLAACEYLVDSIAQHRGIGCQVRAYRDSPDGYLVPWKQVAGEAQKQRDKEQPNTNHPVKFSWWLLSAMIEDTDHMQRDCHNHQVGGPAVHVTYQVTK